MSIRMRFTATIVFVALILFGILASLIAISGVSSSEPLPLVVNLYDVIASPGAVIFFSLLFAIAAGLSIAASLGWASLLSAALLIPAFVALLHSSAYSVPRGAILMFGENTASEYDTCPTGWREYTDLAARVPLGAGISGDPNLAEQTRILGDEGGIDHYQITVNQMPRHSHPLPDDRGGDRDQRSLATTDGSDEGLSEDYRTGELGGGDEKGGEALGIMPPFHVVQFCMKI